LPTSVRKPERARSLEGAEGADEGAGARSVERAERMTLVPLATEDAQTEVVTVELSAVERMVEWYVAWHTGSQLNPDGQLNC
jgi:hypothetical protein